MEKLIAEIEAAKKRGELEVQGPVFRLHGDKKELGFRKIYTGVFGIKLFDPHSKKTALSRAFELKFKDPSSKELFFERIQGVLKQHEPPKILQGGRNFTHAFVSLKKYAIYVRSNLGARKLGIKIFQNYFPVNELPKEQ
ncbi:MAG: hypothetical protein AABY04_02025, partial [Candidatus Micrarchaeota archaeon]